MALTENLLKALDRSLGPIPELDTLSDESLTTQADNHTKDTVDISLLVLMMHELLSCISIAPMASVHARYNHLFGKLEKLDHLLYPKFNVTTDQIIEVLILHQSIVGLVQACPHTFIVNRLDEYLKETKEICKSLNKQYANHIIDNSSVRIGNVTVIKTLA